MQSHPPTVHPRPVRPTSSSNALVPTLAAVGAALLLVGVVGLKLRTGFASLWLNASAGSIEWVRAVLAAGSPCGGLHPETPQAEDLSGRFWTLSRITIWMARTRPLRKKSMSIASAHYGACNSARGGEQHSVVRYAEGNMAMGYGVSCRLEENILQRDGGITHSGPQLRERPRRAADYIRIAQFLLDRGVDINVSSG